jgi:hypothetical protein
MYRTHTTQINARTIYNSSPILTTQSNCNIALLFTQGVTVAVLTPVALLQEVILESYARALIFALLLYLKISVWLRTVGKEEVLFICRAKQVVSFISVMGILFLTVVPVGPFSAAL